MDEATVVESLTAAPAGVALLQGLEAMHRDDVRGNDEPLGSRPDAVEAATRAVRSMTFGELLREVLSAATWYAGPWMSEAPARLTAAFGHAGARTSIAAAVADRFTVDLMQPFDGPSQQWWTYPFEQGRWNVRLQDLDHVYCCGELPWQGLWTVSDPPAEVHGDLVWAWELPEPVGRWRLPPAPTARVIEISAPADWRRLVATYPRMRGGHGGWELPGPNQHVDEIRELEAVSHGAGARHGVRVAMPDWTRVAEHVDGVHLSWLGMLACEGHVVPVPELGADVVTMLRYWHSERTLWLADVFEAPSPLPAPALAPGQQAVSVIDDADRRTADLRNLAGWLGRDPRVGRLG